MKHPTSDEWMAYLYDEDGPAKHAELQAHARACGDCAARLRDWSGGRLALDQWMVHDDERVKAPRRPLLKMAVAALLLVACGIAVGRGLQKPSTELTRLRAELLAELDQRLATLAATQNSDLRQAFADLAQFQEERRSVERDATIAALGQLDNRYSTEMAALRSELETVALNTEGSLIETRQELGLLARSAQQAPTGPQ